MKKNSIRNVVIAGTFSLIIATVFYFINQKNREPLYTFKDTPTLIYNKDSSTPIIKLIKSDSIPISENVYTTKLVLWNNGELPILKNDIRKSFYILLVGEGEIVEAKIIKETHPEISNFKLTNVDELIRIDWEFFDPDYGVEVQFLYSGNNASYIEIDGLVLGNNVRKVHNGNTLTIGNIFNVIGINIGGFLFLGFIGLALTGGYIPDHNDGWSFYDYFSFFIMLLTLILSVLYIIAKAWGYRPPL